MSFFREGVGTLLEARASRKDGQKDRVKDIEGIRDDCNEEAIRLDHICTTDSAVEQLSTSAMRIGH